MAFARTEAKSYLDRIGTKSLTPAQARGFLEETLELTSREADWALDDELVVYK